MRGVVRRRDGARHDLITISRHLAREAGVRVAERFLTVAETTFRRLAAHPASGTRHEAEDPAVGELRFLPLPSRFRVYLVFYRPMLDGIEVVRVLHGARDLGAILAGEEDTGE